MKLDAMRRLLDSWQQTRQEMIDNGMRDVIRHGELSDKVIRLRGELEYALLEAAPALLRVAEAAHEVTYNWSEEAMERLTAALEAE